MTSDESIGLIAGGTGITPMLQVAQRIVENEHDATKVTLIFANVREEDILLRSKIEELAAAHPRQLKVYYVLDEPPEGWKGGKGYLTKEMLAAHLPPPSGGPLTKVLLCGPPGMVR
jgi:cytochrome-b5 reductase